MTDKERKEVERLAREAGDRFPARPTYIFDDDCIDPIPLIREADRKAGVDYESIIGNPPKEGA